MYCLALVRFPTGNMSHDEILARCAETAPRYRDIDGLICKNYLVAEDHKTMGGAYVWASKGQALAWYNDDWKSYFRKQYDCEPDLTFYECPVVVDNKGGEIVVTHRKTSKAAE